MKALQATFDDIKEDEAAPKLPTKLSFPKPISEPPSPISSRATSRGGEKKNAKRLQKHI